MSLSRLIRQCSSSQKTATYRRSLSSSLTPEEAGRQASNMAKALLQPRQSQNDDGNPDHLMDRDTAKKLSTLLSHAGIEADRQNAPQAPPLNVATTYTRPPDGPYKEGDFKYARMDNPTRLLLEKTICELECIDLQLPTESVTKSSDDDSRSSTTHHPTSLAFASGLMAVTSILLAHSSPITVVMGDDLYHGTSTLFFDVFANHSNVRTIQVDMSQTSSIVDTISQVASDSTTRKPQNNDDDNKITTQHLKENIIIWMETPSNPKCQIVDIEAICKAVQHIQQQESIQPYVTCTTVVDGTMSSPVLTRSLNLGADISLHSATKYLGGHSDALLGILTTSPVTERGRALQPILRKVQVEAGGVASPWDSWLVLRGLRTLAVRVERQCRSALQLAEYLETKRIDEDRSSSLIRAVHYPGLTLHPQHGVASRQMEGGYGGVLSLQLTDEVAAMAFAGALQTIHRATSLGGTETLIEHRASIEPPERTVSPPGLLRISVGLEDPDDLIRDMEKAFTITADICGEVA